MLPMDKASRRRMAKLVTALCAAAAVFSIFPLTAGAESIPPMQTFIASHYLETLTLFPALTLLTLLAITVRIDPYIRAGQRKIMRITVAAVILLVAQNFLEYRLAAGELRWLARTLTSIFGYAVRPVILVLFLRIIQPKKRLNWAWALVGVNAAVHTTALFSHVCFWIDTENHYQGGPLSSLCLWVSALLMVYLLYVTIRVFRPRQHSETWVPTLVLLFVAGAVAMDHFVGLVPQPLTFLSISVIISSVAYYIWLHLQLVREHEEALVAGQRVRLMLSQIKPHFLYNSLGAIEELCASDPATAKAATAKFSRYLRGNMDSLSQEGEIPFEKELEHTRLYLELEQLRFEDALKVKYDIACMDFPIPPLTLEPLVENAVRHGVRKNPDGRGTVTISTREYPDRHEISVADDGPGFDLNSLPADGRSHVGIHNVRDRVLRMCGGVLRLESAPGRGTTATMILPKETEIQEC